MTKESIKQDEQKQSKISTTLTGMIIGFLGAAVLYDKNAPDWVPLFLTEYPTLFFGLFIVICGILGYIWALTD